MRSNETAAGLRVESTNMDIDTTQYIAHFSDATVCHAEPTEATDEHAGKHWWEVCRAGQFEHGQARETRSIYLTPYKA